MKLQTFFLILSFALLPVASNAQWSKGFLQNDCSLSYGAFSCISLVGSLGDVEVEDVEHSNVDSENRKTIGSITFQYLYRNARIFSFGISASYEQSREDILSGFKTKIKAGELTNTYITVMPLMRFNWIEKKMVSVYSKVGLGITFIGDFYTSKSSENIDPTSVKQHYLGCQLSPVGVIIGNKVCGFAEVGYGTHGAIQAGLLCRFK